MQAEAFEKQKNLYADYEEYKTSFGQVEANKRFDNELKTNKQLLEEQSKIVASLAVRSTLGGGLNGAETARFEQAKKNIADLQVLEGKRYTDAYNSALTFNQKIERINEEYAGKAKSIRERAAKDNINPDAQIAVLNEKWQAELNGEKENALKRVEVYKDLNEQIISLTREQIKEQLKSIASLLNDPSISSEIKEGLKKLNKSLNSDLDLGTDKVLLNNLEKNKSKIEQKITERKKLDITSPESQKALEDLYSELVDIQGEIDKINKTGLSGFLEKLKNSKTLSTVTDSLSLTAQAANTLSQALGGLDSEAGYTLDTVGQLAGAAADIGGAILSGNPAQMVGAAIKAVGTLFSIGKKVKEMNAAAQKEVADFYATAIAGERAYQDKLKERELQTIRNNKVVLQGIRDEIALRKSQFTSISSESEEILKKLQNQSSIASETYIHGTWFRKAQVKKTYDSLAGKSSEQLFQLLAQGKLEGDAKALVERLQELEQKGYDTTEALAGIARELNELFTGTTVDELTNRMSDIFTDPKSDIKDLANFFEDTMETAALSIFKNKILSEMMTKFYDEFAKNAQSGDELTASEIEALRTAFLAMSAEAQAQFENLKRITGLDLTKKTTVEVDGDFESFKEKLSSILISADDLGEGIENILKDHILQGLKAEIFTDALKPLFEKIKALYANGSVPTKEQIAQIKNEYTVFINDAKEKLKSLEEVTGLAFSETLKNEVGNITETISSELKSIEDSILGIFSNTENSFQDFENNFNNIVKNSILEQLRVSTIKDKLTGFYEEFQKLSTVDDSKKKEQLALLKAQYDKIIQDGQTEFNRLQDVFGVSLAKPQNQSALSASIGRSITEDTASVLSGTWIASLQELVNIANQMKISNNIGQTVIIALIKIEQNTRRSADNTEGIGLKLDRIISNTNKGNTNSFADNYLKT